MAWRRATRSCIGTLILVGFLYLIARVFVVQTLVITSDSMAATLLEGDFVVVNRAAVGARVPFTDIRIPGYVRPAFGDVFVFDSPSEPGAKIVKRVIGLPGDTVEMRARVLYLNGESQQEPYIASTLRPDKHDSLMRWQQEYVLDGARDGYRPSRDNWGPLTVPAGSYLMLGDNRDRSVDSRFWGFVTDRELIGEVIAIYYSHDRGLHLAQPAGTRVRAEGTGTP